MENLLHIFTTSWNDQRGMGEFITWYRNKVSNCKITVYDNLSDDNTKQIALENNCEVFDFHTDGKMDEKTLIEIRNNCWKNSDCKYIAVVDLDELIDIDLEELENNIIWTVNKCNGVEIFGHNKLFRDSFYGVYSLGYSKKVLWLKEAIREPNLEAGSHNSSPIPNEGFEIIYNENPFKLYHTKWQDWEDGLARQKQIAEKGISQDSKSKGWNFHYGLDENTHRNYFENGVVNSIKIK